jgi:hypothetical protein
MIIRNGASYAFDITPGASIAADAGNTAGYPTCYVYTKASTTITVTTADGQNITFTSVPAFTILGGDVPIAVKAVTASTGAVCGLVVKNT